MKPEPAQEIPAGDARGAEVSGQPQRDLFLFCACCPCPCRRALPADAPCQTESVTPSGLALIALAVIDGQLPRDAATRAALRRTDMARLCRPACPYGLDTATAIEALSAQEGLWP